MRPIATGRIATVAAKYGENAPMATACCNACRTCVMTNVVGVALALVAASGARIRSLFSHAS